MIIYIVDILHDHIASCASEHWVKDKDAQQLCCMEILIGHVGSAAFLSNIFRALFTA